MKRFDQKLISAKKKSNRIFFHQIGCHDCQEGNPLNVKKKNKNKNILKDCALSRPMEKKHQSTCKNSIIPKKLDHLFKHAAYYW